MKKIKLNAKLIRFLEYAAVVLSGCIFVLVSASWTSPLFPEMYGYDSAWYSLMGRAITSGYVPYRDYFDLKGPVFFFIEALGQLLIKGRNGIFLIECIAAAFSSVFIFKTASLFLKKVQSWIVLVLYYFVYIFLLWGGNTCEEYLMPFNYACIYLMFRFIKELSEDSINDGKTPDIYGPSFFFGISFGIMALSKITVAAPLCACVITVLFFLIKEKRAKLIPGIILIFIGGVLTVAIPVFVYFMMNGALKDFLYCAFEFAFKRSTDYYEKFSLEWEKNLSICYAGLIGGIILKTRERGISYRRFFLVVLSIVTYLALHLGTPYTYYFITEIPVFVMLLIDGTDHLNRVLEKTDGKAEKDDEKTGRPSSANVYRLLAAEALILMIVSMYSTPVYDKLSENLMYLQYPGDTYYEGCIDTWDYIPFYERQDVYNLESGMIIYEINRALPTNKYPVNLPYFLHLDPVIKENVLAYLDVKKPKWIISEKMEDFDDEDTRNYVFSHYELKRKTSSHEIYKRKDP